jgi:RNAse (barnase) inhibitor barstar
VFAESMKIVLIDWSVIRNQEDFYVSVLAQTDAPSWHGHNLDAISDSWVTGGICPDGPPFNFVFRGHKDVRPDVRQFSEAVSKLVRESVAEHGGEVTYET